MSAVFGQYSGLSKLLSSGLYQQSPTFTATLSNLINDLLNCKSLSLNNFQYFGPIFVLFSFSYFSSWSVREFLRGTKISEPWMITTVVSEQITSDAFCAHAKFEYQLIISKRKRVKGTEAVHRFILFDYSSEK